MAHHRMYTRAVGITQDISHGARKLRTGNRKRKCVRYSGSVEPIQSTSSPIYDCYVNKYYLVILVIFGCCHYISWIPLLEPHGQSHKHALSLAHNSLLRPYSQDYTELLNIRTHNVQLWQKSDQYRFEYNTSGVDRRSTLSIHEFFDVYDGKWPVLLTDVVTKWPAYHWTGAFLNNTYGNSNVMVKAFDMNIDTTLYEALTDISQIPYLDTIDIHNGPDEAINLALPLHLFYKNIGTASPTTWTYITDETFISSRPELKQDVPQTDYLSEDFFHLFPKEVRPRNAMFLWGTKYSRSSLHIDPYNWTGTNAVISGRKLWKLFPPGQDEYLYVKPNRFSGLPVDCHKYNSMVDAFDVDPQQFPLFEKAKSISFEQLPGELLIIPPGWFHQAYNSEETIAISGQVMNRNNYRVVLEEIIKAGNVQREALPAGIDNMAPTKQVQSVMSLLPPYILRQGQSMEEQVHRHANKMSQWTV